MKDAAVGYLIARRKRNEMDGSEENQCKPYNGGYRCVFSIRHSESDDSVKDHRPVSLRGLPDNGHTWNVLTKQSLTGTFFGSNDIERIQY